MQRLTPRAGYTLIEIMVVIAIILVLIAVGAAIGPNLLEGQRNSSTRTAMRAARAITTEYQVVVGEAAPGKSMLPNHLDHPDGPINWSRSKRRNTGDQIGSDDDALDGTGEDAIKQRSIERFVWATRQMPDIESMYAEFDSGTLTDEDGNGFLELRDGWGFRMIYVKYVDHDDRYTGDDFLPARGDASKPQPYFASPGADGYWGDVRELQKRQGGKDHDASLARRASDNVYSFD